jgi:hypothetical protein
VGTVWFRGENGAELSFDEGAVPPAVQARADRGLLQRIPAPEQPAVPKAPARKPVRAPAVAEDGSMRRPGVRASRGQWRAYAVSQGMSRRKAGKMTKAGLVKLYREPNLRAVS